MNRFERKSEYLFVNDGASFDSLDRTIVPHYPGFIRELGDRNTERLTAQRLNFQNRWTTV
jgi:hypothetical protein